MTDADLADTIRQTAPGLFQDGRFVGKDAYAAMLAQQNVTIAEFESDLRRQILINRLREVAIEGTIVTPLEIEQAYRRKNEKIKIEYVKIPNDKYRAEAQAAANSFFHNAQALDGALALFGKLRARKGQPQLLGQGIMAAFDSAQPFLQLGDF